MHVGHREQRLITFVAHSNYALITTQFLMMLIAIKFLQGGIPSATIIIVLRSKPDDYVTNPPTIMIISQMHVKLSVVVSA